MDSYFNDFSKINIDRDLFPLIEFSIQNSQHLKKLEEYFSYILKNALLNDRKSIIDYYNNLNLDDNNDLLEHKKRVIETMKITDNLFNLFQIPKTEVRHLPSFEELVYRVEELERELSSLKIRMTYENLLTEG